MKKILITRKLIKSSEEYAQKVFNTKLNEKDKLLTKDEIIQKSNDCDGILSSITDKFDESLILKLPNKIKIISNFAVGYGNIDIVAASKKNIIVNKKFCLLGSLILTPILIVITCFLLLLILLILL